MYDLPTLHPLTETAMKVHGWLNSGASGRELYRLADIPMTRDEFENGFTPMMQEWNSIVNEYQAKERAKPAPSQTADQPQGDD